MKRKIIITMMTILTISISLLSSNYFHKDLIYTHFYYLPIALAAVWFPKYIYRFGVFFACLHLFIEWNQNDTLAISVIIRSIIILAVTFFMGEVW